MTEREIQAECLSYLRLRNIRYSRTENGHKGRNLAHHRGDPDCTVYPGLGRVVFIEFKAPGGRLSAEQLEFMEWCFSADYDHHIIYDFETFQALIDKYLTFHDTIRAK
jgi:hypothetical protein